MRDIKKYVQDNYEFDKDEINDHLLYKRFMRVYDKLKITVGYDEYEKMLDFYTDDEMGSCYYLMTFICMLDKDKRLLNASLSVIDDIVRAIYNFGLNISNYKKYLDIVLDPRVLMKITQLHDEKRKLNVDSMHVLMFGLEEIEPDGLKEENINIIINYYEKKLEKPLEKKHLWFDENDDFDKIAAIVLDKMHELNEFTRDFSDYNVFSESECSRVEFISKLKYLDLDRQKEILAFFHQIDEEPKGIKEKCLIIISTAQSYYRSFGNDKVIYADFSKKHRNR